jgi:hypothetical protein
MITRTILLAMQKSLTTFKANQMLRFQTALFCKFFFDHFLPSMTSPLIISITFFRSGHRPHFFPPSMNLRNFNSTNHFITSSNCFCNFLYRYINGGQRGQKSNHQQVGNSELLFHWSNFRTSKLIFSHFLTLP